MESIGEIARRRGLHVVPTWQDSSGLPDNLYDPDCPVCGGAHGGHGWVRRDVPVEHPDFGEAFLCECRRKLFEASREQRMIRSTGLPEAMRSSTFETWTMRDTKLQSPYDAARKLAQGIAGEPWLFLYGQPGTGKTHLAAAVLNARIDHPEWGRPVGAWVEVPELMRRLRSSFRDDSYDATLDIYQEVPLLILDDLGAEYRRSGDSGSWAAEQIYLVLNYRATRRLETVVTTNQPLAAMDERIVDRLLSTRNGLARAFGIDLPSYRSGQTW